MVTMKDVARAAGVSTATVSRVLNGKDKGRIKQDIASEVRQQAQLLGYRPNPVARSLRTRSSRILGFISDEISTTPFAGRILLGAQDAARELGYILFAVNTGNDAELEAREIDAIKRYGADGFLYAMMYNRNVTLPQSLHDEDVVLVDARDESGVCPSISPDERRIGRQATERLLKAGCRRIMYLGANVPIVAQVERLAAYREVMERSPYGYDPSLVVNVEEDDPDGEVRGVFEGDPPDGVFCFNDVRAPLIYREAARLGLTVGKDLSVVSVDNQPLIASVLSPALTSIELPHYEMGYWAVRKLVSMIEDRDVDTDAPVDVLGAKAFGDPQGQGRAAADATGADGTRDARGGDAPDTAGGPHPDAQAGYNPYTQSNDETGIRVALPPLTEDIVSIGCRMVEKQSVAGSSEVAS